VPNVKREKLYSVMNSMLVTQRRIPAEEQAWLNDSFVDPTGRVFEWYGEIYREIRANNTQFWNGLFQNGVIDELVRDGLLVDSEPTSFCTDAGGLVIHHRKISVVSYCFEWLPEMLQHAAILTIDLCIRLAEKDLTLQDGHPWNILFEGTRPIFVDLGSVIPAREDILWAPYQQFCNFFLFPLYLYAAGQDRIARWLLRDYLCGVQEDDVLAALPLRFKIRHSRRTLGIAIPKVVGRLFEKLSEQSQQGLLQLSRNSSGGFANRNTKLKFFDSLKKNITGLKLVGPASKWSRYYTTPDRKYFVTNLPPQEWQLKGRIVQTLIDRVRPSNVLDIGSNAGYYARLAALSGARVTACELDIGALSLCYEEARKFQELNILPLVCNVFSNSPIPGRGGCSYPPATRRLRSELVMALALVHHVVAEQRLNISRVVDILNALSTRWLLVEYVKPLPPRTGASRVHGVDDYTSESFEAVLRHRFRSVERFPSYPDDRKMFWCEK
jgi:hypothetical protein